MVSGEMTLREVLLAESYQMEIADLRSQLADAQAYATSAIAQRDKAEAELAAAKAKADALDRLEEMRANVQFYGDIVQLVQYDPYRCTDKNTTSLIDAINEADRKDKP